MRRRAFLALATVLGLSSASFGSPAFTYSEAQSVLPASSTDLVNVGQPTYSGFPAAGFQSFTDSSGTSSPGVLNDGSGGTYGVFAKQTAVTTQATPLDPDLQPDRLGHRLRHHRRQRPTT